MFKTLSTVRTTIKIILMIFEFSLFTKLTLISSDRLTYNVSICVRAGLPKPRLVPDTERIKDTKALDYASTPLDANTLL
jgi:hypothetical protein